MRRVVVTGLGMVSPLGCGVETSWSRLLSGDNAAQRVENFDVSDISCKVACQIPRGDGSNGTYNPDDWMEPKEQRKVDEFIPFDEAYAEADWSRFGNLPALEAGNRVNAYQVYLSMEAELLEQ